MFVADPSTADLRSLETALRALCASVDPEGIPLPEVGGVWTSLDRIEKLAAGAKCRMARRVDESREWRRKGHRSAADWMASQSGTTVGKARAGLETSERLASLPGTDAAAAAGELSGEEAEAVADGASADPGAEQRLLGTAKRRNLRDLRDAAARAKAGTEDGTARHERLHRQRALRTFKGHDGSWNLSLRNTPEVGAEIEAALAPITDRIFHDARLAGRHEPREAYAADALTEMARSDVSDDSAGNGSFPDEDDPDDHASDPAAEPAGGGSPRWQRRSRRPDTKVIAFIDYEALKRGVAEAGETCEIAGVGPVPVATVRSMLGDAFGAAIVTNGVDVFNVAHLGRTVSAHQRTALEARGYRCEVPECGSTVGLEIDHIEDWVATYETRLDCLCWLCRRHHLDKTHRGWRLAGPPGNRLWLPPDGPDPPTSADRQPGDVERPSLFSDLAST